MKNMSEKFPPPPAKERARKEKAVRWAVRALLFLFASLLTTMVIRFERKVTTSNSDFAVGEPSPRTLFSSIEMRYENKKATQMLREEASLAVAPVYRGDPVKETELKAELEKFFATFEDAHKLLAKGEKVEMKNLNADLSRPTLRLLMDKKSYPIIKEKTQSLLHDYFQKGIFEAGIKENLLESGTRKISWVDHEGKEILMAPHEVLSVASLKDYAENDLNQSLKKNRSVRNAILEITENFLRSNVIFDEKETAVRQKKVADAVSPVIATIKKNQLIAQRGMLISEESKERIVQMHEELEKNKAVNKLMGTALLVGLAYFLSLAYLFLFEKRTFASSRSLSLWLFVLILNVAIGKGIQWVPGSTVYLMPTALAPLLLVLLMRPSVAILSAFAMTIFAALMAENYIDVIVATLVSGFVAVFAGLKIRRRARFLKVGSAIGLAYFMVFLIFRIFYESPMMEAFHLSTLGIANGLLVTLLLSFIFVPLCENIFNVMTDISLLELSDLNHPLLKRMVVEAPGTYHHSLVVSTLAEGACEAIGANALLARVGCYFHDIGKIARAEFFTENQSAKFACHSKHEQLSPKMSSVLIMNHVKDGIELGKKYKLKEPILKFIPEHQGTGIVYFFYRKALDEARPGEKVLPDDYRYPGPKPQSRETAVALLSDSTEAASRSLKNPNPDSIRQLVRKIINDKFIDGQLDECDLTLKDLHKIQETFVQNLMAIFHTRVSYPQAPPEATDKPDLFQEGQFSKYRIDPSH